MTKPYSSFKWTAYNLAVLPVILLRLLVALFFMFILQPLCAACEWLLEVLPGIRRY